MSFDQGAWHIKREIQVGHILTTITLAAAAFFYISAIERRIALVEASVVAQKERDAMQDANSTQKFVEVSNQLGRVENKLDRLIERRSP